eukprot:37414-Pyramimonas_sp.AAC.1
MKEHGAPPQRKGFLLQGPDGSWPLGREGFVATAESSSEKKNGASGTREGPGGSIWSRRCLNSPSSSHR